MILIEQESGSVKVSVFVRLEVTSLINFQEPLCELCIFQNN